MDDSEPSPQFGAEDQIWSWIVRSLVVLTLIWIAAIIFVATQWQTPIWKLELNTIGDFLVGLQVHLHFFG